MGLVNSQLDVLDTEPDANIAVDEGDHIACEVVLVLVVVGGIHQHMRNAMIFMSVKCRCGLFLSLT